MNQWLKKPLEVMFGGPKDNDAHTQFSRRSGSEGVEETAQAVQTKPDDEFEFVNEASVANGPQVGRVEAESDATIGIDHPSLRPGPVHLGSTHSNENQNQNQKREPQRASGSQRGEGRYVERDRHGDRGDGSAQDREQREHNRVGRDRRDVRHGRGSDHHGQRNTDHQTRSSSNVIPLDAHHHALGKAENKLREMEARMRGLQIEVQSLQNVSQHKDALLEQNRELLEVRMTELKGTQTFLTTEDRTSVADVVRTVKSLNEEIFQASAFMADSLQDALGDQSMVIDDCSKASSNTVTDMKRLVGRRMLDLLRSSQDKEGAETLSQYAIQTCLAACCMHEIGRWDLNPDVNSYLGGLYREILKTELPSVSSRWRAITRAKSKHSLLTNEATAQTISQYVEILADLLIHVGLLQPASARAEVTAKFQARIAAIIKLTRQLHKMIGEDIISRDLQVYSIEEGKPFDERTMMDAFEENSSRKSRNSSAKGAVICTIGLGLRTVSGDATSRSSSSLDVLLKAAVVVDTNMG